MAMYLNNSFIADESPCPVANVFCWRIRVCRGKAL